jgi:glutaredoxin
MRYVVFAKESCPYCVKTVELLEDKEQNFKVVNFEADQTKILGEIKEACRWETVPMIFKVSDENKIKFVGGYTDLTAIFDGD